MAEDLPTAEKMNESLGDLVDSLNSQIHQLQSWLKCRHIKTTVEDKEELEQIEKRITSLELTVSAMDDKLRKEEESLLFISRMSECVELHNKKISYIIENLPNQLPVISDHHKLASNALSTIINYNNNRNQSQSMNNTNSNSFIYQQQQTISPSNINNINNNNNNNQRRITKTKRKATSSLDANPRAIKRRKMNDNNNKKEIPQIEIVGKDDFDSVPKYIKGRLTQNRLNDAINEFNKKLITKYRVLWMNPSKMNKHQFDLHEEWMKEETKETKHCYWLNHDDFKQSTNFTFDQTGKAVPNVMRHLKRIKMISGKKPKFVVL